MAADFIDPDETGAVIKKTKNALAVMRHRGQGPNHYNVNGRILYDRREVEAWVRSQGSATVSATKRATRVGKTRQTTKKGR